MIIMPTWIPTWAFQVGLATFQSCVARISITQGEFIFNSHCELLACLFYCDSDRYRHTNHGIVTSADETHHLYVSGNAIRAVALNLCSVTVRVCGLLNYLNLLGVGIKLGLYVCKSVDSRNDHCCVCCLGAALLYCDSRGCYGSLSACDAQKISVLNIQKQTHRFEASNGVSVFYQYGLISLVSVSNSVVCVNDTTFTVFSLRIHSMVFGVSKLAESGITRRECEFTHSQRGVGQNA